MENGKADHGQLTRQRVLDAAPEATAINASQVSCDRVKDAALDDGIRYMAEEFIPRYGVKILTRSVGSGFCRPGSSKATYWQNRR